MKLLVFLSLCLSELFVACTIRAYAAELTENNASSWIGFAEDGAATIITDDSQRVKEGDYSIKFETESGFSMAVEDADMQINVDESTKIYLDTGAGNANKVGSEEDCRVGRTVEVYLHESGVAYWVKIKMP